MLYATSMDKWRDVQVQTGDHLSSIRHTLWKYDLQTQTFYHCTELLNMLGLEGTKAHLDAILERVLPKDRKPLRKALKQPHTLRYSYQCSDGQVLWLDQHAILERGGKRLLGVTTDISAQVIEKQLGEHLHGLTGALFLAQTQQEIFDIIVERVLEALHAKAVAVFMVDATHEKVSLIAEQNVELQDQSSWLEGEIGVDSPIADVIIKRETLFLEASVVLPLLLRQNIFAVLVVEFKEVHYFSSSEKQFLQTLETQINLSLERIQLNHQLHEEERHKIDILESISDAFYAVDHDWRFIYVNRHTELLWGIKREDLIGKIGWDVFPQVVNDEVYFAHLYAAKEKKVVRLEVLSSILHIWIEINIHPSENGLAVYFRDISERKRAESVLKEFAQTLEGQVEERTKRWQDLNAELRALANMLAHDLEEPLRRVSSFAAMIEKRLTNQLDERTRYYFELLRSEAHSVSRVANDLRGLSNLENRELNITDVPLRQLIVQIRSDLELISRGRKITWRIEDLPTISGDALLLRQVFTELLMNALKTTKNRTHAVIEVGIYAQARESEILIFVRDNREGFDQVDFSEELFHFDPKSEDAWSGVGLANVRRILRRHGGNVWAKGSVAGMTFFVVLPQTRVLSSN